MNIAILLGQSEYNNIDNIPACKNDIAVLGSLIRATGKYDKVIVIDDKIKKAAAAKIELSNAIKKYKNSRISEVFLYFTGHGFFDGIEFYYIWKDFNKYKKNQTSLINSEIDDMVKQLSPQLYVKVVDACNSGIIFVKETGSIEKYFYDSRKKFNKFYFMFSSHGEQFSLADHGHSFFSSSFVQSLDKSVGKVIRYKDVIDFISDSFEMTGSQTPIFITQADFTEYFCTVNKKIKNIIKLFFDNIGKIDLNNRNIELSSAIKVDSEKYVDFETAKKCLICGSDAIESFKIDSEIDYCYTKEVKSYISYDLIPNMKDIASWISTYGKDLYVDIVYENEMQDGGKLIDIIASLNNYDYFSKNNYKKYFNASKNLKFPKFFENKFDLPYNAVFLTLKSKFSNILNSSFAVVPVLSRDKIYYFYSKLNYNRIDWDEQGIDMSNVKWELETFDFNCFSIKMRMNRLINDKFISVLINDLKSRFIKHSSL